MDTSPKNYEFGFLAVTYYSSHASRSLIKVHAFRLSDLCYPYS